MKNKLSPISIVFTIILIGSLIAGLALVNQNQNQQRGAFFTGASLSLQPEVIDATMNNSFTTQLWVKANNNSKVNSVDATLCYGETSVMLNSADPLDSVELNKDAFKVIEYINNDTASHCLRFLAVSTGIPINSLKSGLIRVANIKFKAIDLGEGNITINRPASAIGGYNPDGGFDALIKVANVANAHYRIFDVAPASSSGNLSL